MDLQYDRHLPLSGTYNIRDLGGYAAGTATTQWRRVLRADALHRLDEAGVAALVLAGVRMVIDLRHADELESAPNPFSTHEEVRYLNVSLFDGLTPPPRDGLDENGHQFDLLLEFYKLALAERQGAIRDVLGAIADAPEGAVLFHCTAGKDRTGITAALLLALSGVDADAIVADYALTGEMIAPMLEELIEGARARGADIEAFKPLLASNPETMRRLLDHIDDRYGSISAYLATVGLDAETQTRLQRRLLGDGARGDL
jgi:protein-tyrosine phosphatase